MEYEEPPPPQPLLLIVSHARTSPLRRPVPDLKYDVRAVHNPPKQIRDKFTGLDRRLREHMLSHGDFAALLDRAEAEVKERIRKMTAGDAREGIVPLSEWRPARPKPSWLRRDEEEADDEDDDESGEDAGGEGEVEGWDELLAETERRPTLAVSVFCVRGRHRSVAFVEELSARSWPKEWEVKAVHRDLARSRKGSNAGRKFSRRDSLGRGFLGDED